VGLGLALGRAHAADVAVVALDDLAHEGGGCFVIALPTA
jgi:hypothetical protein